MLRKIDMVAIYVQDWPTALTWYQENLGLTAIYVEKEHSFAVLALPGGGPVVHLVADPRRPPGARNRCVPNVSVDDFEAALHELRRRGVEVVTVQRDEQEGYQLATLADPEGNELNIYTMVTTSAPTN